MKAQTLHLSDGVQQRDGSVTMFPTACGLPAPSYADNSWTNVAADITCRACRRALAEDRAATEAADFHNNAILNAGLGY